MKYESKEEIIQEIHRRGRILKEKHDRRVTQFLSASTALMTFLLIGMISVFSGTCTVGEVSSYGAFLLPVEAGGYVLTAVIAFMTGVAITVILKKMQENKN